MQRNPGVICSEPRTMKILPLPPTPDPILREHPAILFHRVCTTLPWLTDATWRTTDRTRREGSFRSLRCGQNFTLAHPSPSDGLRGNVTEFPSASQIRLGPCAALFLSANSSKSGGCHSSSSNYNNYNGATNIERLTFLIQ